MARSSDDMHRSSSYLIVFTLDSVVKREDLDCEDIAAVEAHEIERTYGSVAFKFESL